MEKQINQVQVADQIGQSLQQAVTPLYDHIELTDEEIQIWTEWALAKARKAKAAKLAEIAYVNKIKQERSRPVFNYEQLYNFVLENNKHFVIDDNNREIFELLCQYFSNDPAFELSEYSFKKGIMLVGPVGCGKTEMMRVFATNTFRPFMVKPCMIIADDYAAEGHETLYDNSKMIQVYPQLHLGHDSVGLCYDDLGTEDDKKNFGNQVNVMQDILFKIYDSDIYRHFHLTTNIGGVEIEAMYGKRVRSRMREMFNVITFNLDAPDRRE